MKKTIKEFKEFIAKGNVIDMAVGVIIGGAFGKIVTSLVNDVLMPLLGLATGGVDFSTKKLVMSPEKWLKKKQLFCMAASSRTSSTSYSSLSAFSSSSRLSTR